MNHFNQHPTQSQNKSYKLFIGCIPGNTTEEQLFEVFKDYEDLFEVHLERRKNNKCSGYGHIKLKSQDSYEKILSNKQHKLNNRKLTVLPYLEKTELIQSQLSFNKRRIVVAQLPNSATEPDLFKHFSVYGKIERAFVVKSNDFGLKPYAHVIFADTQGAEKSLKVDHIINGKMVILRTHKLDLNKKKKDKYAEMGENPKPEGNKARIQSVIQPSLGYSRRFLNSKIVNSSMEIKNKRLKEVLKATWKMERINHQKRNLKFNIIKETSKR